MTRNRAVFIHCKAIISRGISQYITRRGFNLSRNFLALCMSCLEGCLALFHHKMSILSHSESTKLLDKADASSHVMLHQLLLITLLPF